MKEIWNAEKTWRVWECFRPNTTRFVCLYMCRVVGMVFNCCCCSMAKLTKLVLVIVFCHQLTPKRTQIFNLYYYKGPNERVCTSGLTVSLSINQPGFPLFLLHCSLHSPSALLPVQKERPPLFHSAPPPRIHRLSECLGWGGESQLPRRRTAPRLLGPHSHKVLAHISLQKKKNK